MRIVRRLRPPRDGEPAGTPSPWRTMWLTARCGQVPETVPADRHLARAGSDAADRLMRGELSRAGYQAAMTAIAARDALADPFDVSTTR